MPAGSVRWYLSFAGESAELDLVAGLPDGSIMLVGQLIRPTSIGPWMVEGPSFLETIVAARIDADGTWLWANAVPSTSDQRFSLGMDPFLTLDPKGSATVSATLRGTVDTADVPVVCPSGQTCTVAATIDLNGTWKVVDEP